jgi:hypothetical protein
MTNSYTKKSKIEHVQKGIDFWVDRLIKTTDQVLVLKEELKEIESKPKPSNDEKKKKDEHKANIATYTEGITSAEKHISILERMLEAFEKDQELSI